MKTQSCSNRIASLIAIAAALALCTLAFNPWLITTKIARTAPKYVSTTAMALLALGIAIVIRRLARLCLRCRPGPWLHQQAAIVYLVFILPVVNTPCIPITTQIFKIWGTCGLTLLVTRLSLLIAFELFWLAMLDDLFILKPWDTPSPFSKVPKASFSETFRSFFGIRSHHDD